MLMTAENLKPVEQAILSALTRRALWMTRTQLAEAIGRPTTIQPADLAALERLERLGLIETRQTPRGIAGIKWEYKAK